MFGRATITLGIGPHSSLNIVCYLCGGVAAMWFVASSPPSHCWLPGQPSGRGQATHPYWSEEALPELLNREREIVTIIRQQKR